MKHRNSWVGLALAVVVASACRAEKPSPETKYGEPVGIRMATKGVIPAYEIAIAVSEGADIGPLVPVLSAALHAAVERCPEVVRTGERGEIVELAFTVEQGAIREPSAKGEAATCVARALGGAAVVAPDKLAVLAQIRFPAAAPSATGAP